MKVYLKIHELEIIKPHYKWRAAGQTNITANNIEVEVVRRAENEASLKVLVIMSVCLAVLQILKLYFHLHI